MKGGGKGGKDRWKEEGQMDGGRGSVEGGGGKRGGRGGGRKGGDQRRCDRVKKVTYYDHVCINSAQFYHCAPNLAC